MIDVGLLHHLEELARIGAQGLDVTPLPLGIDGVEGEARLARARQAGDHRQRLARDIDVDILEIVLARAADGKMGEHRPFRSSYVLLLEGVANVRQRGAGEMGFEGVEGNPVHRRASRPGGQRLDIPSSLAQKAA